MKEEHFAILRRHMVEVIGIHVDLAGDELGKPALHERVLSAMGRVPRHAFVPSPLAAHAYHDAALPIGFDKTISQPFIVAVITDLLEPRPNDIVLEVGTGLGYQAAVLAQLVRRVWSVEIIEELRRRPSWCLRPLLQQLKPGGRMVLPTGLAEDQRVTMVEKDVAGRARIRELMSVRFGQLETVR
jgi:protein-L-isoaspartate(D-aspartate) O-methyltransferase